MTQSAVTTVCYLHTIKRASRLPKKPTVEKIYSGSRAPGYRADACFTPICLRSDRAFDNNPGHDAKENRGAAQQKWHCTKAINLLARACLSTFSAWLLSCATKSSLTLNMPHRPLSPLLPQPTLNRPRRCVFLQIRANTRLMALMTLLPAFRSGKLSFVADPG